MNLTQIIKETLKELGAEKYSTLIPTIEKEIEPLLKAKAKKLVTKRRLVRAFNQGIQLELFPTQTEISHDKE